ncbi:MAG: hypothetical protein WBD36_07610 [Bacteroidota bacterium]
MNHSPSSSFGVYELCRILVPGFYFTSLLTMTIWAVAVTPIPITGWGLVLLFLFVVLTSGLTMYAKETTKRRKAFLENQPSSYLQAKARVLSGTEPLNDEESRHLYFYLLNNYVPQTFHEKIFYFGTIYHIMIQIRRTSFWFGLVAVAILGVELVWGAPLAQLQGLVVFTVLVWLVYFLNVRYNKADRKMQENYQDQIFWLEMNDDVVKDLLRKRRSFQKNARL